MTQRYFFVGEKPSPTAHAKNITWQDGGLAAKQLFDALKPLGIDPTDTTCVQFFNLFGDHPDAIELPRVRSGDVVDQAHRAGWTVVAMGEKVAAHLRRWATPHIQIVHPAARGRIRGKAVYASHIKERLAA
jgi:hypothetical protein